MNFKCKISDINGKISNKTVQGEDKNEVIAKLESDGFYVLNIEVEKKSKLARLNNNKSVLELTQSLSLMIKSGLTLKESFEIASTLHTKGNTAILVEQLNTRLRKGDSFSQAIEAQGELFSPLYKGMIKVGQQLGRLDQILPSLAEWLEKRKDLKNKITGALIYPVLVLSLVFIGVSALLIFFLPYMEEMMQMSGGDTQQNLNQSYIAAQALIATFISVVLIIPITNFALLYIKRNQPAIMLNIDRFKLTLPIFKSFLLTQDMLSLNFALSVLTQCGVPLEEALLQAAEVLENSFIKQSLLKIHTKLLKGDSLSKLTDEERIFPKEFSRWIGVGERIGKMDKIFMQLKSYYQKEMDKIINRILTLAEPTVIIILGIILVVIILNVVLPLLTMYGGM